jgi:AcrR family transcriptional regulator
MQVLKAEKLETVVDGAARVFAQVSYRRAMMSDIAAEAGVSLATLYRYAETKEALFELALRRGFGMPLDLLWSASRRPEGFRQQVIGFIREKFAEINRFPVLTRAVAQPAPTDVHAEVEAIVGELYDGLARYQLGIRILDRSTGDWPELGREFVTRVRGPVLAQLERYLRRRTQEGILLRPPDLPAAARILLETCAMLAMHRHYTSGGSYTSDALARATALHVITSGIASPGQRRATPAAPPPRR